MRLEAFVCRHIWGLAIILLMSRFFPFIIELSAPERPVYVTAVIVYVSLRILGMEES